MSMADALTLFLSLVAVHAVCDFPLQGDFLSAAKRPGGRVGFPWPCALGVHGMIHGGGVALITGSWTLGLLEAAAHAAIDGAKCRGLFGNRIDGALHIACKAVWVWALVTFEPGF